MGYFHWKKLAFLSSLIRKYMLWEGLYHDFSTKKVSASGGFAPWPPPRGSAPWTPARGRCSLDPRGNFAPSNDLPWRRPLSVCNVRDIFFCKFVHIRSIYTDRNKLRKHHHATTLDFTNLPAKLLNLCSWKIQKAKWHFSGLDIWRFRFSRVCLRAVERVTLLRFPFGMHPY